MKNETPSEVYVHMADNGFWWQQLYFERGPIFRTGKLMPAYAGMRGWPRATIRYQTRIATHTDHLPLKASQFCIEIIAQKSQTERLTTLE